MDVIKSSRFWLALAIILGAVVLAVIGRVSGTEASTVGPALLAGFRVGKATGATPTTVLLLVGVVSMGGCGQTVGAQLERAHVGVVAANTMAMKAIGDKCLAAATACGKSAPAQCPAWVACDSQRAKYISASKALDSSLATVNRLLVELGVR